MNITNRAAARASRACAKVHRDPVAITSSGDILINPAYVDDLHTVKEVVRRAKKERSAIFVGFVVNADEVPLIHERLQGACKEGAAFVVGKRQKRRRARRDPR
jgi:hypothetical protein